MDDVSPGNTPTPEELHRRSRWFEEYTARLGADPSTLPLRCPCCRCLTLQERSAFEICPVCFWEDDGQDDHDAMLIRGGPNGTLSLTAARLNYARIGACEDRFVGKVRLPRPDELADSS